MYFYFRYLVFHFIQQCIFTFYFIYFIVILQYNRYALNNMNIVKSLIKFSLML